MSSNKRKSRSINDADVDSMLSNVFNKIPIGSESELNNSFIASQITLIKKKSELTSKKRNIRLKIALIAANLTILFAFLGSYVIFETNFIFNKVPPPIYNGPEIANQFVSAQQLKLLETNSSSTCITGITLGKSHNSVDKCVGEFTASTMYLYASNASSRSFNGLHSVEGKQLASVTLNVGSSLLLLFKESTNQSRWQAVKQVGNGKVEIKSQYVGNSGSLLVYVKATSPKQVLLSVDEVSKASSCQSATSQSTIDQNTCSITTNSKTVELPILTYLLIINVAK